MNVTDLTPDPANPNSMSDEDKGRMARALAEYGDLSGIVFNRATGKLVGGHQRASVMCEGKVCVTSRPSKQEPDGTVARGHVLHLDRKYAYREVDWTEERAHAALLAANRFGRIGEDDSVLLKDLIEQLDTGDMDMDLTGFTEDAIALLMEQIHDESEITEDIPPDPPEHPNSERGRMYQLGAHRLMCGDSTDEKDVARLMDGEKADMVFTDPPYGISVVKNNMVGADFGIAKKGKYIEVSGDNTTDAAKHFFSLCCALGMVNVVIWGGNYFSEFLPSSGSWVVWNKRGDTGIVNTFADCELAWSNIGGPARIHNQLWNGMIREGEKEARSHPTQKPVALAAFCFDLVKESRIVFDGFGGSGTALIACEQTNRSCRMMEIDPRYCDVIVRRYANLVGADADKIFETGVQ